MNQKDINNTSTDEADQKQYNEIVDLLNKVKDLTNGFSNSGEERAKRLSALDKKIDESLSEVDNLFDEIEKSDKSASSEMDTLILDQIKDLSSSDE